jgi:hypothetical protein
MAMHRTENHQLFTPPTVQRFGDRLTVMFPQIITRSQSLHHTNSPSKAKDLAKACLNSKTAIPKAAIRHTTLLTSASWKFDLIFNHTPIEAFKAYAGQRLVESEYVLALHKLWS